MRNYLNNLGLRSKVVLLISAVVLVLLTSVLAVVCAQSHWQMERIVQNDMESRKQAFISSEGYRIRDRAHIAALVGAKMSAWTEHPDEKEMCQYFDKLLSYTGSDPNDSRHIDYVALQAPDGKVLGVAIGGYRVCDPQLAHWRLPDVSEALAGKPLATNWESPEQKIYSIYAARITKTGTQKVLGIASIGYMLDDEAAKLAKVRAGTDVVYWHEEDSKSQAFQPHLLGTSNPVLISALLPILPDSDKSTRFSAAGSKYLLQQVMLNPSGVTRENPERIHIGMVESVTECMKPLVLLKRYLAILAVCSLLIGVGLGVMLSRPIVKPLVGLASVAQDVEKGNYDGIKQLKSENKNVFESLDEIGILCRTFEDMVTALKQRAAMSKLISQAAYNCLGNSGSFKAPTERKWMALLFSDIRGFTSFSEGRDPEFVIHRLNKVLGFQAEVVTKHGGDVDKFIGDAMVAWFSGPDRCQRAIEAAQEIMVELSARIGNATETTVGVGVHVGEVIVGGVGSQERMDYTAIGSTVNLAARLCSAAKSGQILVSQAVVTEMGGAFDVRQMAPLSLKGFADPISIYEVSVENGAAAPVADLREQSGVRVN